MLLLEDFFQLVMMVLQSFFRMILFSQDALFFWLIVLLVAFQYRKMQQSKEAWFGISGEPVWPHIGAAVLSGLVGGLAGSFLMVFVGVNLADIGIAWLWPLAIVLMLVHPRFLCFSYAGGLISLSYLLFGFPQVNVPQLMALVALLHLVEAILIFISGHVGAVPVYLKNRKGHVIGAFNLQKLWPIPIVALAAVSLPPDQLAGASINMPDWWPLLKPAGAALPDQLTYVMFPVMAALGYGDLAATSRPQEKTRRSAVYLFMFSFVLLGLAVAASYAGGTAFLAALFSPLGHELVIWLGQREELSGDPLYIQPEKGVLILDVLRNSPAHQLGLASGDIILHINGAEVNGKGDLAAALEESWGMVEVEWLEYPTRKYRRNQIRKPLHQEFGTILAPGSLDYAMVEFHTGGLLARWIRKR
ncbi:PDZ domain-containing protein [Candidatus Formimonas warabiya]|nr:PDZ domain-containing protein [Candidatus Formimonas warabiya]